VLLLAEGIQVDVDLELSPALTPVEAHRQSEALEAEMIRMLPEAQRVAVHLEPRHERARPAVRHAETALAIRTVLADVHGEMSQIERQLRLRVPGVDQIRSDPDQVEASRELQHR
jgi:hypothetical protein